MYSNENQEPPAVEEFPITLETPSVEETTERIIPETADDIREKLIQEFESFKPQLLDYHAYAQRVTSLSVQYHNMRLGESLGVPIEELVLLTTFRVADTPKTLDMKLASMAKIPNLKIKRIFFDRKNAVYYVFV